MMDPNNYYKTNALLRFMRFFNLLEPDRNVLSVSKTFAWVMLVICVYVLVFMPDNFESVMMAVSGLIASLVNYGYRRHVQNRNSFSDDDEMDDQGSWRGRGPSRDLTPPDGH